MKTANFAKEAKELNDLAKEREASFRRFCVTLADLQRKVIDAGIIFKWWARDYLINPRTGNAWHDGTLHSYVQLGRKTDEEWREIRARKSQMRGRNLSVSARSINEQVEILMIAWEQISEEARRIFLDQVTPSRRKAA